MAKEGQQIDELFISLGLDIAKLQLDFDTAGKTVSNAIAKINSSSNKIKLQMETDLSKLDGVGSELDKIKIKHEAINRQLDLQRQKESILAAILKDAQKNTGADSYSSRKAEADLLKQQKLIAETEAAMRKLEKARIAAQGSIQLNVDSAKVKTAINNINDSIARANAKIQNIRLKAEVDISALPKVNSTLEKEKISARALNQELDLQRQKLVQLQNAYNVSKKNYGNNNIVTINAQGNILQQQQEIAKLQNKIRELNNAKIDLKVTNPTVFSRIAEGATKAKTAVTGFVDGVNKVNSAINTGTSALSGAMGLFKLSENTVKAGHDTYMLSTRLHTTTAEAGQLKRMFGMIDGEATMIIPIFTRLGKQLQSVGEDGNLLTDSMKYYDFTLTDSQGKMLPYIDMLGELAKGYRNAQEAGETTEFISGVLGARGTNLEPLLANYEALKAASKDVKATGLMDPVKAEESYREIKKMEFEIGQLKGAMGAALLPVTREMMPEVVQGFRTMVTFISDNKEGLKSFGQLAGDVFGGTANLIGEVVIGLGNIKKGISDISGSKEAENFMKQMGFDAYLKRGSNTGAIVGGMIGGAYAGTQGMVIGGIIGNELGGGIYSLVGEQYLKLTNGEYYAEKEAILNQEKKAFEDLKKIKEKLGKDWDESADLSARQKRIAEIQKNLEKEMAQATSQRLKEKLEDIQSSTKKSIEAGQAEATAWKNAEKEISKAIKETRAEAEKANEELKQSIYELTHNDYQIKIDKINSKSDEMLNRGADVNLVKREADLQLQKIKDEFNRDVLDKADETYQTELEKKLNAIDAEKRAWEQKGLDEVAATEWAENEKSKIILDLNNEVSSKVRSIWGAELDIRLAQIEQEKQAWIKKGISESYATKLAEAEKAKVIKDFNTDVVQKLESIWRTELENRLKQIEIEKQAWIKKGVEEVKATEWAEQAKVDARRNAAMSVLKQQAEEYKVFKNEGYGGLMAYKRTQLIDAGIDPEDLYMTPQQLDAFQKANNVAEKSLLPNFMTEQDRAESKELLQSWYGDTKKSAGVIEINGQQILVESGGDKVLKSKYNDNGELTEKWEYNPTEFYNRQMRDLNIPLDTEALQSFNQQTADATQKLADFGNVISVIANNQQPGYYSDSRYNSNQQPITISPNITVQIENADAWDTEHIQKLADKVADQIEPAVVNAIGGNSNSY